MINRKITLDIAFIGDTLKFTLENVIKSQIEGLCINEGFVKSAHDVSIGGILVAISKMSICGNKGVNINNPNNLIQSLQNSISISTLKNWDEMLFSFRI